MFKQGAYVEWSDATGIAAGTGRIRGIATTAQAVLGSMYIVQLDQPIENYAYSCVALAECHLKLLPYPAQVEPQYDDTWVGGCP